RNSLMMNKSVTILLLLIIGFQSHIVKAQISQVLSLNAEWRIHIGDSKDAHKENFNDSTWKQVTLPHAWNENEAFAKAIHEHSTNIVWYRKNLYLPADVPLDKVFLEF